MRTIFIGVIFLLVIVLLGFWLTPYREPFEDIQIDPATLNLLMKTKDMKAPTGNPKEIIQALRGLLDKFDKPEMWDHAKRVHTMNPGELARLELGI